MRGHVVQRETSKRGRDGRDLSPRFQRQETLRDASCRALWLPWFPHAIAQHWPFLLVGRRRGRQHDSTVSWIQVFKQKPNSDQIQAFLDGTIAEVGNAPPRLIADREKQFDCLRNGDSAPPITRSGPPNPLAHPAFNRLQRSPDDDTGLQSSSEVGGLRHCSPSIVTGVR